MIKSICELPKPLLNWQQHRNLIKVIKNYDLEVAKAEAYDLVKKFVQD
jgi:hypothetical protein